MKLHLLAKIGCGVMIGFLVPLSSVQSAEDPNDRIQAHLGEGGITYARDASSPVVKQNDAWQSQGAQGPIRTDMSTDSESAAKQRQMENQLYPMNAQGGCAPRKIRVG